MFHLFAIYSVSFLLLRFFLYLHNYYFFVIVNVVSFLVLVWVCLCFFCVYRFFNFVFLINWFVALFLKCFSSSACLHLRAYLNFDSFAFLVFLLPSWLDCFKFLCLISFLLQIYISSVRFQFLLVSLDLVTFPLLNSRLNSEFLFFFCFVLGVKFITLFSCVKKLRNTAKSHKKLALNVLTINFSLLFCRNEATVFIFLKRQKVPILHAGSNCPFYSQVPNVASVNLSQCSFVWVCVRIFCANVDLF